MLKLSILDNVVYRVLSHLQDLGVHWVTRRQWAMAEGKGSGPARQLDLSSTYIVEDGYDLPTKFDEICQCVEERVRLPGLAMSGTDSFRSANPSFPPSLPKRLSSTPISLRTPTPRARCVRACIIATCRCQSLRLTCVAHEM
jgi:hypothetical protein